VTITKGNITTLAKLDGPEEQKQQIFKDLGDLAQYELLGEDVLVAVYAESNVLSQVKTHTGEVVKLYGTDNRTTESRYQGKVGLIIKMGPVAWKYHNNGQLNEGIIPSVGDWVAFYPSDGRELYLRGVGSKGEGVTCRKLHWTSIFMRVPDPRVVH
jgi:hypothetical protein